MDQKAVYKDFSNVTSNIPVFFQPWYLDIVCGSNWHVSIAYSQDDQLIGVWPYIVENKAFFKLCRMPIYTPFLGPFVVFPKHIKSNYKRISHYRNTVKALEKQLPPFSYINIKLIPNQMSWYPFYEMGYAQTSRYTYVISHANGVDRIARDLKPQLRNIVNKETHKNFISQNVELDAFLDLVKETLDKKGAGRFFDGEKISEIIQISKAKKCGEIYGYYNENNELISAIFIIKDNMKNYLLLTSTNSEGKSKEAVACLIWQSLQETIKEGKDFDFEGSMILGVEKFFRSFGGEQIPYHEITKTNSRILKIRNAIKLL